MTPCLNPFIINTIICCFRSMQTAMNVLPPGRISITLDVHRQALEDVQAGVFLFLQPESYRTVTHFLLSFRKVEFMMFREMRRKNSSYQKKKLLKF